MIRPALCPGRWRQTDPACLPCHAAEVCCSAGQWRDLAVRLANDLICYVHESPVLDEYQQAIDREQAERNGQ